MLQRSDQAGSRAAQLLGLVGLVLTSIVVAAGTTATAHERCLRDAYRRQQQHRLCATLAGTPVRLPGHPRVAGRNLPAARFGRRDRHDRAERRQDLQLVVDLSARHGDRVRRCVGERLPVSQRGGRHGTLGTEEERQATRHQPRLVLPRRPRRCFRDDRQDVCEGRSWCRPGRHPDQHAQRQRSRRCSPSCINSWPAARFSSRAQR